MLVIGALWCSLAYTQEYTLQKFDIEQGLPSNAVYQVTQDKNGYIWISTTNGLCRYDGISFKNYTNNYIFSEDMPWLYNYHQRIYCTTWSGKLGYIQNDSLYSFYPVPYEMRFFLADGKEGYWIRNIMGELIHYSAGKKEVYDGHQQSSLYEDEKGHIYYYNPGLSCYDPALKKFVPVEKYSGQKLAILGGLLTSQPNDNECIIYKSIYSKEPPVRLPLHKDENGKTLFIEQVIKNESGEYWVHNYKDILVYDSLGQYKENITQKIDLPRIYINTLFKDRENNIWIGTRGQGLFLIRKKNVKNILPPGDQYISQLVANSRNDLLMSHREGKMSLLDSAQKLHSYTIPHRSTISIFYGLHHDENNFFGVLESQFFYFNTEVQRLDVLPFSKALKNIGLEKKDKFIGGHLQPAQWIYTYLVSANGDIWLGTNKGLYMVPAGKMTGFTYTENVVFKKLIIRKKDRSYFIDDDPTPLDAYKINIQYPEPNNNTFIQQIIQDRRGIIWIATQCEGIFAYDYHRFYHLNQSRGLLSNNVNMVYADDKNRVWIATNAGVSCIQPDGKMRHITTEDGILSNQVNGIYVNKNDQAYLGTAKGLSIVDLNKTEYYIPYPPVITKIRVNEETIKNNDTNITLSYLQNNILVEYLSVNFKTRAKYIYTIGGLTKEWQTTENRSIYLPKLSPGNYFLKIKAVSQDGKESTGTTVLHIKIIAPFWQWKYFWILPLIVLCTIIYLASWYRKKRMLKQLRLQQKIKDLEKKALLSQINPHFVFNCLAAIKYLLNNGETGKADEYLHTFATLMRNTLDFSETRIISLEEELTYIRDYIELEKLRFSQFFKYRIEIQENIEADNLFLPPMLLQPYIENAIRHGLRPKKDKGGLLVLRFYTEGNYLIIKIDDNGIGREAAAQFKEKNTIHYQSKGMNISAQRATLQNIDVFISDKKTEDGQALGTEVTIKIPQDPNN